MHTKFERLLSKSLTTLEVMAYYLVVHTGPEVVTGCRLGHREACRNDTERKRMSDTCDDNIV